MVALGKNTPVHLALDTAEAGAVPDTAAAEDMQAQKAAGAVRMPVPAVRLRAATAVSGQGVALRGQAPR